MNERLPLYVDLIFGGLFVTIFTGSWLVINDLAKLRADPNYQAYRSQVQARFTRIRIRRVVSLLAGIAMIVMYFMGKSMPVPGALIFGLLWLDSALLTGQMRRFINEVQGKDT